ncbi:MAG TPA: hypothetical protein RMH85_04200 [Polyangiaceae bacterium LLY-WYZ-15_(1-7)]|nr:hypothetical protein [Myxococcales bacterium]MAT24079.1 hypothetical protein [Sandaracinus sp.]HJL03934.1 hypothetical protein [Polyangiaceae bacterium LLY-WYZ-15_(1-7)]MBJ70937.1 hypothetical protein [Sandaracinus sp.]HJL07670.1 hypothetical protein [Polyangiaceae bacterium LLY-WYZ-15_(1-7)]
MTRATLFAALASLLLALAPGGCAGETAGRLVEIEVALRGDPEARTHGTSAGWAIELDEAWLVAGPVHVFAPADEPVAARLAPLALARAHGGFDPLDGRAVRAELLEQAAIDALDGTPMRWLAPAEEGPVDELSVGLEAPLAGAGVATRGHQAWVRGRASRGGETVAFEGGLDLSGDGVARRVGNVALDATLGAGGRLTITLDARRWLDGVAFDRLDAVEGEVAMFEPGDQASAAWRVGLHDPGAYRASWRDDSEGEER